MGHIATVMSDAACVVERVITRINPKVYEVKHLQSLLATETKRRQQLEKLLLLKGIDLAEADAIVIDEPQIVSPRRSKLSDRGEAAALAQAKQRMFEDFYAEGVEQQLDVFLQKIVEVVKPPPPIEVRFQDLSWTLTTTGKTSRIPTVGGAFKKLLQLPVRMFSKPKTVRTSILKHLSGILKPSCLTLILGRPGAGKSSFLKAVANHLPNKGNYKVTGSVTFNGDSPNSGKFNLSRIVTYIDQHDIHYPTLTVEETITFSFLVQDISAVVARKEGDSTRTDFLADASERRLKVRNMLKIMGLSHVKDTLVGDALIRGVSGGQKKRVTVCEKLVGFHKVLLMDEISTGLDSSTTYDIISTFRTLSTHLNLTSVISLLQPAPEVYNLFDEVIILEEGQIIYQGPRPSAVAHFSSIGYLCPPHKDFADFLQEVTAPEGAQYFVEIAQTQGMATGVNDFVSRFKASETWKNIEQQLAIAPPPATWVSDQTTAQLLSWRAAFLLCASRQKKLLFRNTKLIKAQVGQGLVMGLVLGSLYFQLGLDEYSNRYGLFFSTSMMLSLGGFPELSLVAKQRVVFYKHRDSGFFPTSAYVLAQSLVGMPVNIAQVCVFGTIMWWMCGLTDSDNGAQYGLFIVIAFCLSMAVNQLLRVIASISPSPHLAPAISGCCIIFMILFSGFIIQTDEIPDYWIWVYWINPIAWSMKAMANLEFASSKYDELVLGKRMGDMYLDAYGFKKDSANIWGTILFLIGYYVFMLAMTTLTLEKLRFHGHTSSELPPDDEPTQSPEENGTEMKTVTKSRAPSQETERVVEDLPATDLGLPFEPCALTFENVWYTVTLPNAEHEKLDLLQGVSGFCRPGTMTALMGSSGAGKTTLLDVIAGRKTSGTIRGNFRVNGHPKEKGSFARLSGYVEQTDLHSPHSTVREALLFSARLRLPPSVSKSDRHTFVTSVLQILELDVIQDRLIGSESEGGLSTEQMKRVTIGVELVANPSILFLDEPTSGLDSRAASIVMRAVRNIAQTNRTVICTIHQPSSYLFEMFDNLLLLKKGGKTVYFGPLGENSSNLIDYMQNIPGAPRFREGQNPATYMLEVIGAGTATNVNLREDPSEYYTRSSLAETNLQELSELTQPVGTPVTFSTVFAASFRAQVKALVIKSFKNYWRSPNYNVTRILIIALVAFIFGSTYKRGEIKTQSDVIAKFSVMIIATTFSCVIFINSVLETVATERAVYYRERAANMYQTIPYAASYTLAELPYLVITSFLFSVIFYFTVGLYDDGVKFLWFWLFYYLALTVATFTGQLIACVTPNTEAAGVIAGLVINIWNAFSGFLISPGDIPPYWNFMYWISPLHYAVEGMVMTQFRGADKVIDVITSTGPVKMTVEEYTIHHFGGEFSYDHRGTDIIALVALILIFNSMRAFALRYLNLLKR
eukprot:c9825_g1_i2.p1 GENE.c9825_g1_i2~~c9825_g1_i2.p1  ORF type:complete len:1420 (-),score=398.97 c9825_g1_i2:102-4361(-)